MTALAFGPDGRLFSGSPDATVLAWDPRAAKPPGERGQIREDLGRSRRSGQRARPLLTRSIEAQYLPQFAVADGILPLDLRGALSRQRVQERRIMFPRVPGQVILVERRHEDDRLSVAEDEYVLLFRLSSTSSHEALSVQLTVFTAVPPASRSAASDRDAA